MTTDWRTGPDPRRCTSCGQPESGCEGGQLFGRPKCCPDCDHPDNTSIEKG